MGGELIGIFLLLVLILCIKSVINDLYAEKQKEIQDIQKAINDNNNAHYPILRQLRQDQMLGRWKYPSCNQPASYERRLREIKAEARKRLAESGVTPNERILDFFFGK